MKKITTILLVFISAIAYGQTYQLNYPDIRIGSSNTGKVSFKASNIQFPLLALGNTTDSVLTIAGGVIKKVPRSQFSGGSSYTFNNGLTNTGGVVGLGGNANWSFPGSVNIFADNTNTNKGSLSLGRGYALLEHNNASGSASFSASARSVVMGAGTVDASQRQSISLGYNVDGTLTNRMIVYDNVNSRGLGEIDDYAANKLAYDYVTVKMLRDSIAASGGGGSTPDTTIYRTVSNSFSKAQTNTQIANALTGYVPLTRTVSTGNGLSGGGALSGNLTLVADTSILPTKANTKTLAQLQTTFNTKQNTLVSGTNIKTVNGNSLLGSGDLVISTAPDTTVYRTVANSRSLAQTQTALNLKVDKTTTLNNGIGINTIGDLSANRTISVDTAGVIASKTYVQNNLTNFTADANDFQGTGTSASPFAIKNVSVAKGGTGATTLTGIVKGNGTSAFTAAVSGTDYVAPATTVAGFPLNANVTLASLTATNTSLTFSGAYNGSTARTVGVNLGNTFAWTAKHTFATPTTSIASINLPQGVAPTTPVNGDIWNTSTVQQHRIGGVTKTVAYTTDIPATPTWQQVTTSGNTTTNSIGIKGETRPVVYTGNNLVMEFSSVSGNVGSIFSYDYTSNISRNLVLQAPGGNVLIGTTTDNGSKLQVSGAVAATGIVSGSSVVASGTVQGGTINSASNITATNDIEVSSSSSGFILKSPNGNRWRITISNTGVLTTTAL